MQIRGRFKYAKIKIVKSYKFLSQLLGICIDWRAISCFKNNESTAKITITNLQEMNENTQTIFQTTTKCKYCTDVCQN